MATVMEQISPHKAEIDHMQTELMLHKQRFNAQPMPSAEQRIEWLQKLKDCLIEHQDALISALNQDFGGRSKDETLLAELMPSVQGINYAIKRIRKWMKPSKRHVGVHLQPAKAQVIYQPLGVVGIIAPWNYPVFLAVGPLTTALAAGNRAMIKMSEYTPNTSALFAKIIQQTFDDALVTVVNGDAEIGAAFSKLPFDHIIFTGSTQVGHHVMRAAADNLTPVTLELGGKTPTIVADDVPMAQAAERICFGKSVNAGQTCVAPDYVMVPAGKEQAFIDAYRTAFARTYPQLNHNEHYSSIINTRQQQRLQQLLEDAREKGAEIVPVSDEVIEDGSRRMPLHFILKASDDMRVLQEEIFGPILPVIPYQSVQEAITYIQERPRPLALYFFSHDKATQEYVLNHSHSGGVGLNEALFHVAVDDLPFGGIGPSGLGHYHGHEGFLALSKAKSVLRKGHINGAKVAYPPYGRLIHRLLYRFFIR